MKIKELENPPQWLLDADTQDADVNIIEGAVHWYRGDWHGGTWYGGRWKKGHKNKLVKSDTQPLNN